MDDNEEILETVPHEAQNVPQLVKTLAILVYIGNAILFLCGLIAGIVALASNDLFEDIAGRSMHIEPAIMIVAFIFVFLIFVFPVIGAYVMAQGRRGGFWVYLIPTLLWILVGFKAGEPANIFFSIVSIGFVIGFASKFSALR